MFDLKVPFFLPVWRRVVTVALTLGWAGFEFLAGSPSWGALFAGFGIYALYHFFIVWDPKEVED